MTLPFLGVSYHQMSPLTEVRSTTEDEQEAWGYIRDHSKSFAEQQAENLKIFEKVNANMRKSGMATLVFDGDEYGVEARHVGDMLDPIFQARGIHIITSVVKGEKSRQVKLIIGYAEEKK